MRIEAFGVICGVLLLVALTGCGLSDLDLYPCHQPDKGHKDANGAPDPCHLNDAAAGDAGSGAPCPGVCMEPPSPDWTGPELVWMGDEAAAPPCPANARHENVTLRRPPAEQICATTCTCGPPSGSCALPATVTAAASSCKNDGPGVAHTTFDPPASWSGACTAANAIPVAKLCGGVPCVQSVTIAPLVMTESDCQPIEQPTPPQPPRGTFARACFGDPPPVCNNGDWCYPATPGPEFKQCLLRVGDPEMWECPSSFPDRSIFYHDFVDNRYCEPACTCGAPGTLKAKKSTCRGSIGLFSDPGCSTPLLGQLSIDATRPQCHDILPAGSALESKSASEPTYKPGMCPVTGGQQGKIEANRTYVICCQGAPQGPL